jgi:hypothetical protein
MFENLLQNLGLSAFSLKGFGPLLMEGTWMTIKLSAMSLLVAVLLGLLGASAKLSKVKLLRLPLPSLHHADSRGAGPGADAADLLQPANLADVADRLHGMGIHRDQPVQRRGHSPWASFTARISPRPSVARSSPYRAARLKRPPPMASAAVSAFVSWSSRR